MPFITLDNCICYLLNVCREYVKCHSDPKTIYTRASNDLLAKSIEALCYFSVLDRTVMVGYERTNVRIDLRNDECVHIEQFGEPLHR